MNFPPLLPDIAFACLPNTSGAVEFSFAAKRAAMEPHIVSRWGWDEDFQRKLHQSRFAEKPFYAISLNDKDIGVLSWLVMSNTVRFGEFYIFPVYQRKGLGSRILKHVTDQADKLRASIRLEHLIWNPVGSLYRRYGFVETSRSEVHVFMTRPANQSSHV